MNIGLIGLCIFLYIIKKPNNFNLKTLFIYSFIIKIIFSILTFCNIPFIVIQFFIVLAIFIGLYKAKDK